MLIVCPSCASEYTLDPDRIGVIGRKVRCAACRESWFIVPPVAVESGPQAVRLETQWAAQSEIAAAQTDIVAAEPEIVSPEPPDLAPAEAATLVIEPDVIVAPTRARRPAGKPSGRPRPGRSGPKAGPSSAPGRTGWTWRGVAAILLILACPGALLARAAIVQALPGTAILFSAIRLPVNLVGLRFEGVTSTLTREGDAPVLLVAGEIVNVSGRTRPVPPVDLVVEGEAGEVLYAWTVEAPAGELEPAAPMPFRARLASPPPAGKRVLVTFREAGPSKVALR